MAEPDPSSRKTRPGAGRTALKMALVPMLFAAILTTAWLHPRTQEAFYAWRWAKAETEPERAAHFKRLRETHPAAARMLAYRERRGPQLVEAEKWDALWLLIDRVVAREAAQAPPRKPFTLPGLPNRPSLRQIHAFDQAYHNRKKGREALWKAIKAGVPVDEIEIEVLIWEKEMEALVKANPELIYPLIDRMNNAYRVCKKLKRYADEVHGPRTYHPKGYLIYHLAYFLKGYPLEAAKAAFFDLQKWKREKSTDPDKWGAGFHGGITTIIVISVDGQGTITDVVVAD